MLAKARVKLTGGVVAKIQPTTAGMRGDRWRNFGENLFFFLLFYFSDEGEKGTEPDFYYFSFSRIFQKTNQEILELLYYGKRAYIVRTSLYSERERKKKKKDMNGENFPIHEEELFLSEK